MTASRPFDLRLGGGRAVLPGVGASDIDVLLLDGKIAGFCDPAASVAAAHVERIDGLVVLPGMVDPHVHLGQDITFPKTAEDAGRESASAACGGVTTILSYLMSNRPYQDLFDNARALMEAHSLVDFGFHFCICTEEQLATLPRYVREYGVSSFKYFMNFRGDEGKYLGLPGSDDGFFLDLLTAAASSGAVVCPHAENIELIRRLAADVSRQDASSERSPLEMWNDARPAFAEAEALHRAAFFGRIAGAAIYAVHVTSAQALDVVAIQRAAGGRLFVETCPHYLTHDVDSSVGEYGKVNPPLRTAADREALWRAVAMGGVDAIGSDHVPRHQTAKAGGIWKASAGFPGLQTSLPILMSEGHQKRAIPLERIAALTSANPAKLFGLYPQKGVIAVGSDADLTLLDLGAKAVIDSASLHSAAGFSIYEGWEVSCRVVHTLVRGTFVVRDGAIQPCDGHGMYLSRPGVHGPRPLDPRRTDADAGSAAAYPVSA